MGNKSKGFIHSLLLLLTAGILSCLLAQQVIISPIPLYFGQIPTGQEHQRYLILRNTSGSTLNVSSVTIQGMNAADFALVSDPGSFAIGAYGRVELAIRFYPTTRGEKAAEVVITSNAGSSPDKVDLTGGASSTAGGVVTFERIIGTLENDGGGALRVTEDGGFILGGGTYNPDEDADDAYLLKTDAYGNVQWMQTYDSDDNDENSDGFSSVVQVSDGYLAVGSSDVGKDKNDVWLVKTDASGNYQWEKTWGGKDDDGANIIEKTSDGNFIIVGNTQSVSTENGRDAYIIKVDGNGTEIWSQTIGGTGGEDLRSVLETRDGSFILAGNISYGTQQTDMYLVKIDAAGNLIWGKAYGGSGQEDVEQANSVISAHDGGYILAGFTSSIGAGAKDMWIIKTDSDGVKDETWGDVTFGDEHHDGASRIIATSDGGYLVAGSTENHYEPLPLNNWYSDACIVKLDAEGNEIWSRVFGGTREEGASIVQEMPDGSFVVRGTTRTYGSNGDSEIYLLRITNQGKITGLSDTVVETPDEFHLYQNYPNPFNSGTMIEYSVERQDAASLMVELTVYNVLGQKVMVLVDGRQQTGRHAVHWNAGDFPSGIYYYRLSVGTQNMKIVSATRKMIHIK